MLLTWDVKHKTNQPKTRPVWSGERIWPNPCAAGSKFGERNGPNPGSAGSHFGERNGPNPGSAGSQESQG